MPLHHRPTRTAAHPAIVRFLHWLWVYAIGCMVFSGWQIYNASPSLPFNFPRWTGLGGWLGGALAWHMSAMWLLALAGIAYLAYGVTSGHLRRDLGLPTPRAVVRDLWSALTFRLRHRIGHYNAVQRLLYLGVIGALLLQVVTGLLNKQVGGELGISEITVKAHRGNMMRKMSARSLPELVNMAAGLSIARASACIEG